MSMDRSAFDIELLDAVGDRHGYVSPATGLRVGSCADDEFFRRRFIAADNAPAQDDVTAASGAIVTGYGPTNAPTAGTLSAMLTTRELQRRSGLPATVIVSDLGAWNSRNVCWTDIERYRDAMLSFLAAVGLDTPAVTLRTHQDLDNLTLSGRIAKFLCEDDFRRNHESLDELYQHLGLRGAMLGVMLDGLYTIADILGPLTSGAQRVIMLAGIEEHYFTQLSKIVLARAAERCPGELFAPDAQLTSLFLGIVPGLGGYPKMSKSIPASSIHLGEPAAEIRRKIFEAPARDDPVIMRMIELASGWDDSRVDDSRNRYRARADEPSSWSEARAAYADALCSYATAWRESLRLVKRSCRIPSGR